MWGVMRTLCGALSMLLVAVPKLYQSIFFK
jgi:hypothetical protein